MQPEPMIAVRDLSAGYGPETVILTHISFDVQAGEILTILGSSGCGKSTLLRHMIGLNPPLAGQIVIDGDDIVKCSTKEFNQILQKIGVLFQSAALIGSMTLAENVALPLRAYTRLPKAVVDRLVQMKLCMVGLGEFADHLPSEISGGMRKRAGLARALALNPPILFLDEPSASLDPVTSAEIDELILHINQRLQTTLVIVTHDLDSIFRVSRRVIMLDAKVRGIIAEGDPLDLKENSANPYVRQFFNRQARVP